MPHGVLERSSSGGLVTSVNFSSVELVCGGPEHYGNSTGDSERCPVTLKTHLFYRSTSKQSLMDQQLAIDQGCARRNFQVSGPLNYFPPWEPKENSPFTDLVAHAFCNSCVRPLPDRYSVHAGLECGELLQRLTTVEDCASIGPTILGAHSPNERLSVESAIEFVEWTGRIVSEAANSN